MAKIKKQKSEGNGFPQKYTKIPGFTSCMQDMDAFDQDGLKKSIVESETNIEEIEKSQENDENLKGARAKVNDLSSSYKDAKKYQKAKIKYALFCLERMGQKVSE